MRDRKLGARRQVRPPQLDSLVSHGLFIASACFSLTSRGANEDPSGEGRSVTTGSVIVDPGSDSTFGPVSIDRSYGLVDCPAGYYSAGRSHVSKYCMHLSLHLSTMSVTIHHLQHSRSDRLFWLLEVRFS